MKGKPQKEKNSRFPLSTFWIVLAVLLGTAGISMGIIICMDRAGWMPIIQTHIMVLYWISVSVLLTWLIRSRMKVVYDAPMQAISDATKKVAQGDFTVRIDALHDEEKEDYLDLMIHDLNTMIAELGSIETLKTDFVSNVSHEIKTPISAAPEVRYADGAGAKGLLRDDLRRGSSPEYADHQYSSPEPPGKPADQPCQDAL